jgi:hypothetical protein
LSFCRKFQYFGRSLEDYPEIAELKVAVWKAVYQYLSPISKVCPPNGVQMLTYFIVFWSRINAHMDMNPKMAIDPETNSQIVGSSVIVVSFFAPQEFLFTDRAKTCSSTGKKRKTIWSFVTDHCSIYVMDPEDDSKHYHCTRFTRNCVQKDVHSCRICFTLRWLGGKAAFLGSDYKGRTGNRKHTQTFEGIHKYIENIKDDNVKYAFKQSVKRKTVMSPETQSSVAP